MVFRANPSAQDWERLFWRYQKFDIASGAWLAFGAVSFEREHPLVDGGCGNLEVPLHVGFGGCTPEHLGEGVDEGQILPSCGGEAGAAGCVVFAKDLIRLKIHLRGQCLDRRIDDKKRLIEEIDTWECQRNAEGARINWTTDKAREKLRKAYPVNES